MTQARPFGVPMLLAACVAAGCALTDPPAPDQARREALPNLAAPPGWSGAQTPVGVVEAGWLSGFGDPTLVALVAEAQAYNADLAVASARVEQASAMVRIAGAALVPAVGVLARGGTKLSGDLSGLAGVGVSASWELDVWGRVRYGRRAAQATYASAQADIEHARQSVAALVSKAWFLAIEANQQSALAGETVAASERLRALASERMRVGVGAEVDVALASASVAGFRDALRDIEAARLQSIRALETLLGRYPSASATVPAAWSTMPTRGAAGVPSELLERRPDLIAAERRLAAAWDRVGEAKVARLPRLSLMAGVGSISSDLLVLQSFDNPAVSLGANLLAPIFTGGALEGTVALRTAEQREALAVWARTATRAFAEVENALSAEDSLVARETILRGAVADAQRALVLQEERYTVGSADLRSVLQQRIAVYASRMSLLRVQAESRVQRVNLHLALGGGFAGAAPARPGVAPGDDAGATRAANR